MAFLKVLESPDPALKDQTIPITGKEVLIGRGKENTLVLEDHAVSRHHARIVEEPEGHLLVDNNSANGSWVNGQRVTEVRLKPGDQIRLGKSLFEIQGIYDPEGTALLDVQGMGMSDEAGCPLLPQVPVSQPARSRARAARLRRRAPAPPSFEPATTPEPGAHAQAGASADPDSGAGSRPRPATRRCPPPGSDGRAPSGADAAARSGPHGRAARRRASCTHAGCGAPRLLR